MSVTKPQDGEQHQYEARELDELIPRNWECNAAVMTAECPLDNETIAFDLHLYNLDREAVERMLGVLAMPGVRP